MTIGGLNAADEAENAEMAAVIRVFLRGTPGLFLDSLAALLANHRHIVITGIAGLEIPKAPVSSEMILIDASQEPAIALATTRAVAEQNPVARIIVIGVDSSEERILELIEAGGSAYVLKDSSLAELLTTIEAVHRGQTRCSPRIAMLAFAKIRELSSRTAVALHLPMNGLTVREKQVLEFVAEGLSNKEIAALLNVSIHTVKNHIHAALKKLNSHHRREAIQRAYHAGLLRTALQFQADRRLDRDAGTSTLTASLTTFRPSSP